MKNSNMLRDSMIKDFAENYMEKLFYFCLKKTGDNQVAEDLTQDIAFNIINSLNRGNIPCNFPAWVWRIARNRYSSWADAKHRYKESVVDSDIEDCVIADENGDILGDMVYEEQLSLLRRELAFIKSDYRNIVVAYYFENKSIREISSSTSLSVSAVQQRLHRARIILKEGIDMAREFGKRSYNPENITFVKDGKNGDLGQPWSIVSRLLYKNIFLETYENPQTAEELSLELGIALPYMEDDLEFLVREQLLRKEGNKYQTDFMIINKEDQLAAYETHRKLQKPITDKLCELIDLYMKEDGGKVDISYMSYDDAKWALLGAAFDYIYSPIWKNSPYWVKKTLPKRPDNGAWILTGYESVDLYYPDYGGLHTASADDLGNEIEFGQYRLEYNQEKLPQFLSYSEAKTLLLICQGDQKECNIFYVDKLIEYGYVKKINDTLKPNTVIFYKKVADKEPSEKIIELRDELVDLFKQTLSPYISFLDRGLIFEQALNDGWLKYDDKSEITIGSYINI